jgi:hypothetical protein
MQLELTHLTVHHLAIQQLLRLLLLLALCSPLCHESKVVCCCLRSEVLARLSLQSATSNQSSTAGQHSHSKQATLSCKAKLVQDVATLEHPGVSLQNVTIAV